MRGRIRYGFKVKVKFHGSGFRVWILGSRVKGFRV